MKVIIPSLISKFQSKFRANRFILYVLNHVTADPSGREVYGLGLRPLAYWDCGSESRRRNRCLSLVSAVWCQEEVSATGRSLVQRSRTVCGVIAKPRKGRPRSGIGSKRHRKIKPYILYKASGVTEWLAESYEFPVYLVSSVTCCQWLRGCHGKRKTQLLK